MKFLFASILMLIGTFVLCSCEDRKVETKEKIYTLKISVEETSITYCGIVGSEFSLSPGSSYNSANYYYPIEAKSIFFRDRTLEIIEVNQEFIKFKIVK